MATSGLVRFLQRGLALAAAAGLCGLGGGSAMAAPSSTDFASAPGGAAVAPGPRLARLAAGLGLQPDAAKIEPPAEKGEEKKGGEETGKGEPADKWHLLFTPYLWASGFDGRVGIAGRSTDVNASFEELIRRFEGGATFVVEARKDRFGILTELFYIKLEDTNPTPGPLFSQIRAVVSEVMADGALAYRVIDQGPVSLDLYAGGRFWHLKGQLGLRRAGAVVHHFEATQDWVDPILGGRVRAQLNPKLAAFVVGDYGGFGAGSKSTWQFIGGAGVKTAPRQELKAGYRILSVDRENGGFLFDADMSGPFLAYTFGG